MINTLLLPAATFACVSALSIPLLTKVNVPLLIARFSRLASVTTNVGNGIFSAVSK
jgi:hypothetical protein